MRRTVYEDRPKEFWADMGPFFARREVRREMPYLADESGYVWFVLRDGRTVIGFASCHVDKTGVGHLHGLYVIPARRQNGLAGELVETRLAWLKERGVKVARVTANRSSEPLLERYGFKVVKERGKQYREMEVALAS